MQGSKAIQLHLARDQNPRYRDREGSQAQAPAEETVKFQSKHIFTVDMQQINLIKVHYRLDRQLKFVILYNKV